MHSKLFPIVLMLIASLLFLSACGGSPSDPGNSAPPGEEEPPMTDPPPEEKPPSEVSYVITGSSIAAGSTSVFVRIHKAIDGMVDYSNPVLDATVTANGGIPMMLVSSQGYQGDLGVMLNPGDEVEVTATIDGEVITGIGDIPAEITQTAPVAGEVIPAGSPVIIEWTTPVSPDSYAFLIQWSDGMTWTSEPDGTSRSYEVPMDRIAYAGGPMSVQILGLNNGVFIGDQVHANSSLQLEYRIPYETRTEFSVELP